MHYPICELIRLFLGVIELHDRHTAVYLKEKVDELCGKFGLKRWQIYSVTVDNGRNVVKAVDLMKEDSSTENECEIEELQMVRK